MKSKAKINEIWKTDSDTYVVITVSERRERPGGFALAYRTFENAGWRMYDMGRTGYSDGWLVENMDLTNYPEYQL